MKLKKTLLSCALLSIILFQSGCVLHNTQSNEVGVKVTKWSLLNKKGIDPNIYAPASTYFFLPIINDWHTFNINLQNIHMSHNSMRGDLVGQDDIKFKTIDGNDISLDLQWLMFLLYQCFSLENNQNEILITFHSQH